MEHTELEKAKLFELEVENKVLKNRQEEQVLKLKEIEVEMELKKMRMMQSVQQGGQDIFDRSEFMDFHKIDMERLGMLRFLLVSCMYESESTAYQENQKFKPVFDESEEESIKDKIFKIINQWTL